MASDIRPIGLGALYRGSNVDTGDLSAQAGKFLGVDFKKI